MDNAYNFVAFRALILCCGQPYDKPLFESEFLETYNRFGSEAAKKYILDPVNQRYNSQLDVLRKEVRREKDRNCEGLLEQLLHRSHFELKRELSPETKIIIQKSYRKYALTPIEGLALQTEQIRAMRRCYYICLDVINSSYPRNSFFKILDSAREYYRIQFHAMEEYYRFIAPTLPETIEADRMNSENGNGLISQYYEKRIQAEKENITHERQSTYRKGHNTRKHGYQISKIFDTFVLSNKAKYANYEKTFALYKKKQPDGSRSSVTIHFWENPAIQDKLSVEYIDFCRGKDLTADEKKIIRVQDSAALANIILDELDADLMQKLQLSHPVLCTKNGSLCWGTKYIRTAEFLCLFRDLMSKKEYRVCPICKAVFFVEGKGKTRRYCSNHTTDQIDYYNRCLRSAAIKENESKHPSQ